MLINWIFLEIDEGDRWFSLLSISPKRSIRGLFPLQLSQKLDEGGDFCFNLIDMAIKRGQ